MPITYVNVGAAPNDGTGDQLRDAFVKINGSILDLAARTGPGNNLATVTSSLTIDALQARNGIIMATLGGNIALDTANLPASGIPCAYTLILKQDGTGGRTITWLANTTHLNGGNGSVNPVAGSVSVITLITTDGGSHWLAAVADARPTQLDSYKFNPAGNGSYYVVITGSENIRLGDVTKRGTGTIAYAKSLSATPTSFSSVSGTTAFANGDTLKVTVTSFSDWLTLDVPRESA